RTLRNRAAGKPRWRQFESQFFLENLPSFFGIFTCLDQCLGFKGIFVSVLELGPQELYLGPGIDSAGCDLQLSFILDRDFHEVIHAVALRLLAEQAEFRRGGKPGSLDMVGWNALFLE